MASPYSVQILAAMKPLSPRSVSCPHFSSLHRHFGWDVLPGTRQRESERYEGAARPCNGCSACRSDEREEENAGLLSSGKQVLGDQQIRLVKLPADEGAYIPMRKVLNSRSLSARDFNDEL